MDNIELLKRIAELNKCPECGGSGLVYVGGNDYQIDCPTCHGTGAKLPALNETEAVWWDSPYSVISIPYKQKRSKLSKRQLKDIICSAPTLEEVLEMLPKKIRAKGYECSLNMMTAIPERGEFEGIPQYCFAYNAFDDAILDYLVISDTSFEPSPLTAALKLLEWWLQQEAK